MGFNNPKPHLRLRETIIRITISMPKITKSTKKKVTKPTDKKKTVKNAIKNILNELT